MTLIEVLLAVAILVLMIWTFAPFVAATFRQIAQAGALHIDLSVDVSTIDAQIADEYFGAPTTFPVKVGSDDSIDVNGIHLNAGELHTFYSDITNYISTDDILYEGYGNNGLYDAFYSIGYLPEVTDKKFFKNDHTYIVSLIGADGFYYMVDEEIETTKDPKNDIDPLSVDDSSSVFFVPSSMPDSGNGEDPDDTLNDGNPDKIGYLMIIPDQLGLDNSNSPYELVIETKDTGQTFLQNPVYFDVMLPLYQSVGEFGVERIASHINYWVDKYSYTDPNYGNEFTDEKNGGPGIVVTRLPAVKFNDVLWYSDDTMERYYTVGDGGHIWYRYHESDWLQESILFMTEDLNRIKKLGNLFVIIGDSGTVLISSDGDSWTNKSPFLVTDNFTTVSYGASKYLAVAENGNVYYTTDFNTYTFIDSATAGTTDASTPSVTINDMVWTGTYFVAVGDDNYIAVSSDGISWTILDPETTINSPDGLSDLNCVFVYKSSGFIAGDSGQIFRFGMEVSSVAGWSWSTVRAHNIDSEDLYDITFSRKAFVVVGEDGKIMYSLNGTVWTDVGRMDNYNDVYDIFAVAGRE